MLIEACASIHAWLQGDEKNVVAIHCRSGRGRSAVVLSCVLGFLSLQGKSGGPQSPVDWLSHLAQLRGEDEHKLTLPTHRRYLQYFAELLLGSAPSDAISDGSELRGIVLHGFPPLDPVPCVLVSGGTRTLFASITAQQVDDLSDDSCTPQCARRSYSYKGTSGKAATFAVVRGDVVLTVREESRSGQLLCRAGFHVDFAAAAGVLRLPCAALDGAASRLPQHAFIDIMLSPRAAAANVQEGGSLSAAIASLRHAAFEKDGRAARRGMALETPVFALDDEEEEAVVPSSRSTTMATASPPSASTGPVVTTLPRAQAMVSAPVPVPVPLPTMPAQIAQHSIAKPEGHSTHSAAAPASRDAAACAAASSATPALTPSELLSRYAATAASSQAVLPDEPDTGKVASSAIKRVPRPSSASAGAAGRVEPCNNKPANQSGGAVGCSASQTGGAMGFASSPEQNSVPVFASEACTLDCSERLGAARVEKVAPALAPEAVSEPAPDAAPEPAPETQTEAELDSELETGLAPPIATEWEVEGGRLPLLPVAADGAGCGNSEAPNDDKSSDAERHEERTLEARTQALEDQIASELLDLGIDDAIPGDPNIHSIADADELDAEFEKLLG
mmetsp:Transcript_36250/g.95572  ORF Transcript_36250/g.95572 Transcript_36250/m.95572 type:complete len:619 (+) Transcript_36250:368-2224(+)